MRPEDLGATVVAHAAPAVLTKRLEQLVTGAAAGGAANRHHGALDEAREQVERVARAARRLGRREVEGPGEDGEGAEQLLLLGREEVVGPADGVLHRPVARVAPAAGGLQQTETFIEARRDLCEVDRPGPCRCELDRERDPIEAPADLDDRTRVLLAELESRIGRAGSLDEERHRRGAVEATPGEGPGPGVSCRQWIDRPHLFTWEPERLAGGRHDGDGRRLPDDSAGEGRHRLDEVLAVVEHDE